MNYILPRVITQKLKKYKLGGRDRENKGIGSLAQINIDDDSNKKQNELTISPLMNITIIIKIVSMVFAYYFHTRNLIMKS